MKCFWVAKYKAMVGILVIREAPIITPCVPILPAPEFFRFAKATGSVAISWLVVMINGHKKLFHSPIAVKIIIAINAGFSKGRMILK